MIPQKPTNFGEDLLVAELFSLRSQFHSGTDVSLAIISIENKLWELHGEDAVPANPYGEEEDAQVTALAELGAVLADFKTWTGGWGPKEAEDQIEIYIETNWDAGWSEDSKEWLRSAQV